MIIVKILGGLGNQMFQFAFAYTLSQKKQTQLKLDISDFDLYGLRQYALDCYFITGEIASIEESIRLKYKNETLFGRTFRKFTKKPKLFADNYYRELGFQFDETVFSLQGDVYFDGYWQSEKYFNDHWVGLLKIYRLKEDIHSKSKKFQQQILSNQSVSLHIRRGDYVTNEHTNSVHGTCDIEYYRKAVSLLENEVIKPHFFIFSDDLAWAKENLDFIEELTFIELESDIPDHEEMFLMSQCKHNIIANSSFSWWGAWLNQDINKIVISPKKWFASDQMSTKDLLPESWIQL